MSLLVPVPDTMMIVVVLLETREVPLVATALLPVKVGCSSFRSLVAALGCMFLLEVKIIGLFPCRGTLIGMTLLVKVLPPLVTVVSRRDCVVKVLRCLWARVEHPLPRALADLFTVYRLNV